MSNQSKYMMGEDRIPHAWYNIMADLPSPPPPPLHPGTGQPIGPDDLAPLFPMALIGQEVSQERHIEIPTPVRDIYRLWRPTPLHRAHGAREGARDDGAHLLQERGREPGRQPQAQHRRRPSLLQQAGRGDQAFDRDRRRAVGILARLRRRAVRPRSQGLHGQGVLHPEALPASADGALRRKVHRKPEQRDRIRPRHSRPASGLARQPRHRHLGGGRGRGEEPRHEVRAGQRVQPRADAPERDRHRGDRADGAGGRLSGRRDRVRRRRIQLRRHRLPVHRQDAARQAQGAGDRGRAIGLPVVDARAPTPSTSATPDI